MLDEKPAVWTPFACRTSGKVWNSSGSRWLILYTPVVDGYCEVRSAAIDGLVQSPWT